MGIFASRPEEPFEWAGLPSEPAEPESAVERLDAATIEAAGLGGHAIESIAIPLHTPITSADTHGSGEDDTGE